MNSDHENIADAINMVALGKEKEAAAAFKELINSKVDSILSDVKVNVAADYFTPFKE